MSNTNFMKQISKNFMIKYFSVNMFGIVIEVTFYIPTNIRKDIDYDTSHKGGNYDNEPITAQ